MMNITTMNDISPGHLRRKAIAGLLLNEDQHIQEQREWLENYTSNLMDVIGHCNVGIPTVSMH